MDSNHDIVRDLAELVSQIGDHTPESFRKAVVRLGNRAIAASASPAKVGGDEVQRVLSRLNSSDPDFDDCASAAALIIRMAEEMKGPDGFETWKDAALAERAKRVPFQELEKLFLIALDFGVGFGPRLSEVGEWKESRIDKAKALAIQARAALSADGGDTKPLPVIKGAWIEGGYVIVTPKSNVDAPAVMEAILSLFAIAANQSGKGGE